jgi:hypothetical protein
MKLASLWRMDSESRGQRIGMVWRCWGLGTGSRYRCSNLVFSVGKTVMCFKIKKY